MVDLELSLMIILGLLRQLAQMLIEETPVPGVCYISPVLVRNPRIFTQRWHLSSTSP